MKKILVISGYSSKVLRPFGESMQVLLVESFGQLQIPVEYKYYVDGKNYTEVYDTLVIFLTTPERLKKTKQSIRKNNNIFVFWNAEPFDTKYDNEGYDIKSKYSIRASLMKDLIQDDELDHIWVYNNVQEKFLNTSKCSFLPIGYHECLEPSSVTIKSEKTNDRAFVFVGQPNRSRGVFFKTVRKIKSPAVKPKIFDYKRFVSFEAIGNAIGKFRVGVDIQTSTKFCHDHIRWHRIMVYAGAGLVVLSDNRLEEFGLEDKEHYFYFDGPKACANILHNLFSDIEKTKSVHKSMKEKLKKDFYMPDLLKTAVDKLETE